MNRTATATTYDRAIRSMNDQLVRLNQLQSQIATGRKTTRSADDPVAAAQAGSIRGEITRIDVERRMIGFARTILQHADMALGAGSEVLDSARELMLRANTGSLNADDRASIANQIRGLRAELLSVANSRDGSGAFVFGGQGSRTRPFVEASGQVSYVADAGSQQVGQDTPVSTSLDGRAAFMMLDDGSGTRKSIFEVLDEALVMLDDPDASPADLSAAVERAILGIDSGLSALSSIRTTAGEQLRMIENVESSLDSHELDAQTRLSAIVDVDFAAAIAEFAKVQSGLQSGMQTYARLSSMSLFDYIR